MVKATLPEKYQLPAYNQRDVMGLPPVLSQWNDSVENAQIKHNRILQAGFMHREVISVLKDAKKAGVEWLTDVCSPSAKASIILHLGKEMVANYQIKDANLGEKTQAIYELLVREPTTLTSIEKEVDHQLNLKNEPHIEIMARNMLLKNLGIDRALITNEQLEAAKRLVLDLERKKIMDFIVAQMVKQYLKDNTEVLKLTRKSRHRIGSTNDLSFLGAAGSGKSTLAKQYATENPDLESQKINKNDCIVLATDNYRAFFLPGTEFHEAISTKDVFIRSQDLAYMIKELVQEEINAGILQDGTRSNIICDCVTLDKEMRKLLAQVDPDKGGSLVSVVAAYRGEPGYLGIAERADHRAKNPHAEPADKGRYVDTTSLFKGHAQASKRLLSSLPLQAITEIYDTNVALKKEEQPFKIATVDSSNRLIKIHSLRIMSEFLNKKNINIQAEHPVELILKPIQPNDPTLLITNPDSKARALLDLIHENPDAGKYSVFLQHPNGKEYASLISDVNNKAILQVLDLNLFKGLIAGLHKSSPDAQVLYALLKQTEEATQAASVLNGPTSAEAESLKSIHELIKMANLIIDYQKEQEQEARVQAQQDAFIAAKEHEKKENASIRIIKVSQSSFLRNSKNDLNNEKERKHDNPASKLKESHSSLH